MAPRQIHELGGQPGAQAALLQPAHRVFGEHILAEVHEGCLFRALTGRQGYREIMGGDVRVHVDESLFYLLLRAAAVAIDPKGPFLHQKSSCPPILTNRARRIESGCCQAPKLLFWVSTAFEFSALYRSRFALTRARPNRRIFAKRTST